MARAADLYRDADMVDEAVHLYVNVLGLPGEAAPILAELGHHERAVHYWGVSQLLDATDPVPTFHTANSLLALGLVDDALDALDLVVAQCQRQNQHPELAARAEALRVLVRSKKAAA